jgi:class 3 adenylate cyclase
MNNEDKKNEESSQGEEKKKKDKDAEKIKYGASIKFTNLDEVRPFYDLRIPTSSGTVFLPDFDARLSLSSDEVFKFTRTEDKLDEEIAQLKKENRRLASEIAEKYKAAKEREALRQNVDELQRHLRLKYIYDRVNESARRELGTGEILRKRFEDTELCEAVVMSIDIRRSTELMLKAREPRLYADFIINLCSDLTGTIVENYGVFEKFTGDGILSFFPNFYSGEDAPFYAIKAAFECHNKFKEHYQKNRRCFKSVLMDVGLGIGIDYGKTHLVKMHDQLTVIGEPVVYACRLSGGEAGKTLLNQPAYEVISERYGAYIDFEEESLEIKHEGPTLAYNVKMSKKSFTPKVPDWVTEPKK